MVVCLFVCLLVVTHEVSHLLFTDRFGSDTHATETSCATINVSYVTIYLRRVSPLTEALMFQLADPSGSQGRMSPTGPNSFIFKHFSAKVLPNN